MAVFSKSLVGIRDLAVRYPGRCAAALLTFMAVCRRCSLVFANRAAAPAWLDVEHIIEHIIDISLTLWQEVTSVAKSRQTRTEKKVGTVDQSREQMGIVEFVARGADSWGELKQVETEIIGESWEQQKRSGKNWAERGRNGKTLRAVEKSCKKKNSGDGLRRRQKWWSQLKRDEAKWRPTQRTELRSLVRFCV